jgi:argininosuccinate synthase
LPALVALVGLHAARDLLLPRSEESLRAALGDFSIASVGGELVGCAALAALGPGLGEIRTLAVHPDHEGQGIGHALVVKLVADAENRGFREVLVLSRRVSLFLRLGFRIADRTRFLDKLEADCRTCPHHEACDETALVRPPGVIQDVIPLPHPASIAPVRRGSTRGTRQTQSLHRAGSRQRPMENKKMSSVKRVVMAYSGGLDTSIAIPWIKEHYDGAEVVAYCGDVGQGDDLEAVRAKALATGASECIVEDLREEFIRDYAFAALSAGAIYEDHYLLGTALARPLLAYRQVQAALERGADALAHGATGKGNDQVRFEVTYARFAPHLRVIAPWREWDIRSREDALAYAASHDVQVEQTKRDLYSRDGNLWHLSHEGGVLENTWNAPEESMFKLSVDPATAPDEPEELTLSFESGRPVALDGVRLGPVDMVVALNERAGAHGVGRLDLLENRLVGMKSRGVYETPAGTVLHVAHREIERMVLDRDTLHFKQAVSTRYAQLIYDGLWFSRLREALAAFVEDTERETTGEVRMRLFKGHAVAVGRRAPRSLYREDLATFGEGIAYDHSHAEGFIRLFSLPERVRALTDEEASS